MDELQTISGNETDITDGPSDQGGSEGTGTENPPQDTPADQDQETDTNTGTGTDTNTETGTDSGTEENTGSDGTGGNTDTGEKTDTGGNSGATGETGSGENTESGGGPETQEPDTQQPAVQTEDLSGTDSETQDLYQEIMERLELMDVPEDETGITERLDAILMMMAPEEMQETDMGTYSAAIPFEGYEGWTYPINMQFQVYPYGFGNWLEQWQSFSDASGFAARYEEIVSLCGADGTLKDFYVEYIWEDYGGDNECLVYDYQAAPEEPDQGQTETKEALDKILVCLETAGTTLDGMALADTDYYQAVSDYQEQMLEAQALNIAVGLAGGFFSGMTAGALIALMAWRKMH